MEETKVIPPNPEFIGVGCRGKWRSFSAVLTVNPKKTRIQGNSVTRPLAVSLPRPLTKRVKGLEDQMSKIKLKNIYGDGDGSVLLVSLYLRLAPELMVI